MSAFARIFHPLRDAAQAFFKHDVVLRRGDAGLRVVLQARSAGTLVASDASAQRAAAPQQERQEEQEKQALALMLGQLGALLDAAPGPAGSRSTVRHLAFVEQVLAASGLAALQHLPLDVLQQALAQFESLVSNWSPTGLADLRSKMAVAAASRAQAVADDAEESHPAALALGRAADAAGLRAGGQQRALDADQASADEALAAAYAAYGGPGSFIEPAAMAVPTAAQENVAFPQH